MLIVKNKHVNILSETWWWCGDKGKCLHNENKLLNHTLFSWISEYLVKALCSVAPAKVKDNSTQEIPITLNAFAKFEHFDENLVKVLCSVAPGKIKDFNSQKTAMTLNALAKCEHFDENLFKALCSVAPRKMKDFNS